MIPRTQSILYLKYMKYLWQMKILLDQQAISCHFESLIFDLPTNI